MAKLVKFKDGTYGVRYLDLTQIVFGTIYSFQDMQNKEFTWNNKDVWFCDCKVSFERASKWFSQRYDIGTPIKENHNGN